MVNPQVPFTRKKVDPSMKDLLDLLKKDILLNLNCHAIATIQSFDAETQTVSATINYKKSFNQMQADGTYSVVLRDYPQLLDVPVIFLGGGAWSLTFPISPGDTCLILFNDRDIDNWLQSGQVGPVSSSRLHSFSDGIALVGLRSQNDLIEDFDTTRAVLRNGETMVGVGEDKIKIANADTTLNTQLQNLLTELQNLVNQIALITVTCAAPGNPSSVPINAAAITAIGTQISNTATAIGGLLE